MIRMLSLRTVLCVPLLNVPEKQDQDGWPNSGEKGCPAGISGWHSAETVCDTTKVKQEEILVNYRYCTYLTVCKNGRGWALFSD